MLPEEVTNMIGKVTGVAVREVEKGAIKRFADAVDDRNPLYWDEEYARNSRYGAIIAPPGFFGWPTNWPPGITFLQNPDVSAEPSKEGESLRDTLYKLGYTLGLDGGMEYEFFIPIRVGDTLTAETRVKDIVEREGKSGKMVFLFTETTFTNQNGAIVAKATSTSINRA